MFLLSVICWTMSVHSLNLYAEEHQLLPASNGIKTQLIPVDTEVYSPSQTLSKAL